MNRDDSDFRIRPGRIRSKSGGKPKRFINQVLRAAKKAGHIVTPSSGSGKRAPGFGHSTFGRGRIAFSRNRLFSTSRRVVVKARIARHQGRAFRSAPLVEHLSYLKREGVTRDGATARMFDAGTDRADDAAFTERCNEDRHHFRFIVSPEDAGDMTDLKAFTRDLAIQMEVDLGTKLDWVAVDHWNTGNPHIHLLVRGVDQDGKDLVISRNYISRGLLNTLRQRELDAVGAKLSAEKGLMYMKAATGEHITGTYRQRLTLTSGRFAMIESLGADGGLGFQLVPWSPSLEKLLGRHVTGIARGDGGIEWGFGRKQGLGL